MSKETLDGRYEIRIRKEKKVFLTPDLVRWVSEHTGIVTFLRSSMEASDFNDRPLNIDLYVNGHKFNYKG